MNRGWLEGLALVLALSGCSGRAVAPDSDLQRSTYALDGGDCISCISQAENGACYAEGQACYVDSNCLLLAACVNGCSTQACIATCDNNAGPTAVAELAALTTCDCTTCSLQCTSQCAGPDGGTDGGAGGGDGGSRGLDGGADCISCLSQAENGPCYAQGQACYVDANCSLLAACVNACMTQACVTACDNNAGPTAVAELAALTTCDCAACSAQCAAECGPTDGGSAGHDGGASAHDAGSAVPDSGAGGVDAGNRPSPGHQNCDMGSGPPLAIALLAWIAVRSRRRQRTLR
jgi:hypothetical protein